MADQDSIDWLVLSRTLSSLGDRELEGKGTKQDRLEPLPQPGEGPMCCSATIVIVK